MYFILDLNLFWFSNTSLLYVFNNLKFLSFFFDLYSLFFLYLYSLENFFVNLLQNNFFFNILYMYSFLFFTFLYLIVLIFIPFLILNSSNKYLFNLFRFKSSFFIFFNFLPNQVFWYKPFEVSVCTGNRLNLNFDKNFLLSYFFFFKNFFYKSFFKFTNNLSFCFYKFFNIFVVKTWKPVFTKTSYYGLYNSYKNKF